VLEQEMSIAAFSPVSEPKMIPLNTYYYKNYGNYRLEFSQHESLLENSTIFLHDKQLGTTSEIRADFVYRYTVNSTDSVQINRFELVFLPQTVQPPTITPDNVSVSIYPNPSESKSAATIALVGFETGSAAIEITDALGRKVFSDVAKIQTSGITEYRLTEKLSAGLYTVKTSGSGRIITRKMVIR
jgi:hypothetical protein